MKRRRSVSVKDQIFVLDETISGYSFSSVKIYKRKHNHWCGWIPGVEYWWYYLLLQIFWTPKLTVINREFIVRKSIHGFLISEVKKKKKIIFSHSYLKMCSRWWICFRNISKLSWPWNVRNEMTVPKVLCNFFVWQRPF